MPAGGGDSRQRADQSRQGVAADERGVTLLPPFRDPPGKEIEERGECFGHPLDQHHEDGPGP